MTDERDDDEDRTNAAGSGEDEVLDMAPVVIVKKIRGVDRVVRVYEIRDITGLQRDRFLSSQSRKLKIGASGKIAVEKDFTDFQAELIALCLWDTGKTVDDDGEVTDAPEDFEQHRVKQKEISGWPARIQKALHKDCQKVAGLDTKKDMDDDEEGNG